MIVRLIIYHALPDKDVDAWMRDHATEIRGVPGLRKMEFCRSVSDPSQFGALLHFRTKEDLDAYKTTGAYQKLIPSLRPLLDESKPPIEMIMEVLDI